MNSEAILKATNNINIIYYKLNSEIHPLHLFSHFYCYQFKLTSFSCIPSFVSKPIICILIFMVHPLISISMPIISSSLVKAYPYVC